MECRQMQRGGRLRCSEVIGGAEATELCQKGLLCCVVL